MPNYYDQGTYGGGYDNVYTDERQQARDRLLNLLEEQEARSQREYNRMMDEQAAAQYEQDINPHDEALSGAQTGMAFGPWGALAGAIGGRAIGGKKAYDARREQGEGRLEAGFNSFLNPFESIPQSFEAISGKAGQQFAGGLGQQIQGKQSRSSAVSDAMRASKRQGADDPLQDRRTTSIRHQQDQPFQFKNTEPRGQGLATAEGDPLYEDEYGNVGFG